jgi:hypothetical protein
MEYFTLREHSDQNRSRLQKLEQLLNQADKKKSEDKTAAFAHKFVVKDRRQVLRDSLNSTRVSGEKATYLGEARRDSRSRRYTPLATSLYTPVLKPASV